MTGRVALVGAGPGDPELITLRGARALAEADLVLYDALLEAEMLDLAPRARRFYVGKRAGRHALTQRGIERLMIRAARRGLRVVRLKGGDPFVFGRGGEEALALAAAGIPCEVVPGISSAIAAPALAGIPVTHRGLASGFAVVSGHAAEVWGPILEALAPNRLTLVVLMGVANREAIAGFLLAQGWRADTPAALLFAASTPRACRWLGRLEAVAEASLPEGARAAPGTLVVGDCVALTAQTLGVADMRAHRAVAR